MRARAKMGESTGVDVENAQEAATEGARGSVEVSRNGAAGKEGTSRGETHPELMRVFVWNRHTLDSRLEDAEPSPGL